MNHHNRIETALLALKGLSLGDAFGQSFFIEQDKAIKLIELRQLPTKPWLYTDDTVMGISIVETLHKFERVDRDYLVQLFVQRYQEEPNRGYGSSAAQNLRKIAEGVDWKQVSVNAFSGMGSMGNGGAMRAAPVGAYFFDSYQRVVREAKASCEVTHAHPDAQAGAIAVAIAAAYLVRQKLGLSFSADLLLETVIKFTPEGDTLSRIKRAANIPCDSRLDYVISLLGNGFHLCSYDTVPIALWFVVRSDRDFEKTLWNAVAALGDRDTICGIVGSLMALAVGKEKLPKTWIERCESLPFRL